MGARELLRVVWVLLPLWLAGCPLAHEAPGPTECQTDQDCFTAEGEYCDRPVKTGRTPGTCRVRRPDGAAPDRGRLDRRVLEEPAGERAADTRGPGEADR